MSARAKAAVAAMGLIGVLGVLLVVPSLHPPAEDQTQAVPEMDDHFGVILTGGAELEDTLKLLGTRWFQDYGFSARGIPDGFHKAMKVRSNVLSPAGEIQAAARSRPGSYWIIGNEPNVPGQDDVSPEAYARALYYYRTALRQADPTVRIVAPEVLNMDFTCRGCAGFSSGRAWLDGFRQAYRDLYGAEPPIDVWSIHTYDLDWERLPQGDYWLQTQQILAFREYLDTLPEHREKPLWLTEFSVIWPYEGVRFEQQDGTSIAYPEGEYRSDRLREYLQAMVGWLRAHALDLKLERWFIFASHAYQEPWSAVPEGIGLLEGGGAKERLTPLGRLYQQLGMAARIEEPLTR